MATMTIPEAEYVIDIVVDALDRHNDKIDHWWQAYQSVSVLQGYDIFQIDNALKLRIANMYLIFSRSDNFEEKFSKEIAWSQLPFFLLNVFMPEYVIAKIKKWDKDSKALPRDSFEYLERSSALMAETSAFEKRYIEDEKYLSLDTSESFGDYCKSLGTNDPLYWQKIYTHLGLEYSSSSPSGNEPVFLKK